MKKFITALGFLLIIVGFSSCYIGYYPPRPQNRTRVIHHHHKPHHQYNKKYKKQHRPRNYNYGPRGY
ncbi:MAG TPA: hypothetical protein VLZ83_14450 [Edaphocola sp.]|nr:hypothetical protein [Edaphocola sp.]